MVELRGVGLASGSAAQLSSLKNFLSGEMNGGAFSTNSELGNPLKTDAVTASKTLLGLKQTLDMTILALRNSSPLPFTLVM